MPDFSVTGWALSDFSGLISDPANSTQTTPAFAVNSSTTLDPGASQIRFQITDDDDQLEDAFLETGDLSVLTNDLVIDGVTYNAGQNVESEYQLITDDVPPITFIIVRIGTGSSNSGENLLVFTTSPITPGQTYTFSDSADGPIDPYNTICFANGTQIATPRGVQNIEALKAGDTVLTRDHGIQTIRWAGVRQLGPFDLCRMPQLRPIRVRKGALGPNTPSADLIVSPQHRLPISTVNTALLFGTEEVLVAAKDLLSRDGVSIAHAQQSLSYHHILLDMHALVQANGQWAETLLPGPEAMQSLDPADAAEIEALFPDLNRDPKAYQSPHLCLKSWETELLF